MIFKFLGVLGSLNELEKTTIVMVLMINVIIYVLSIDSQLTSHKSLFFTMLLTSVILIFHFIVAGFDNIGEK